MTYNRTDIAFITSPTGDVTVRWYLDLTVKNTTNSVLQNANVTIFNVTNSQLFNGLTAADGTVARQTLTEFVQNATLKTLHTPHTINGTLLKYLDNSTTVNLTTTGSTNLILVLPDDRVAPANITFVSPTQNNNAVVSVNYYTVNATFIEPQPEACLLEVVSGSNISMTMIGSSCYINRTGQSQGTYTYKVHVNDSVGNRGTSSTRTITLDTTVPSVTLPQVNISESVPVTTQIKINVTVTDSSGISAVLVGNATNVTMSSIGFNRYQVNTTPSALGCYSNQATCLLRFYANDTAGNLNSTTTLTLNIFGCGQTLTSSSTLTSSLTSAGSCFTIGADNLVINGAGYSVTGNGSGTAVNVITFTNVTIANLTINNFTTDVLVTTGSAALLNTTFSRQKTTVLATGNLTAKWYVDNVVREWGFDYFEGQSGGAGYCGDSKCGQGEDYYKCSVDCPLTGGTTETCGNSFCGYGETSTNCAGDCGGGAAYCGNGVCNQGESYSTCSVDCPNTGGGGQCNLRSDYCAVDITTCGQKTPPCGWTGSQCQIYNQSFCSSRTTDSICNGQSACQWTSGEVCGNSVCGGGETAATCPVDCGSANYCGNGVCAGNETTFTCASDCGKPTPPGVSGANVTIYDTSGNLVYNGVTDTSGRIPKLELTEFIQNSAAKTLYTVHSINITKSGYQKFSRLVNLSSTGSVSLENVLNNPFNNCGQYAGNQTKCTASKCKWENDTSLCKPDSTTLDCDQFCGRCTTQVVCQGSTKSCTWESGGFCRDNFNIFTYGTGGTTNSSGSFNFMPIDCSKEPQSCDSRYDVDKGYYKFETLCSDGIDNDLDGTVDCSDSDCTIWSQCASSYSAANDTTPPQITNCKTDLDASSASISCTTTEPTNLTLNYYGTSSSCASVTSSISENNLANCSLDDYTVWHHVTIDNTTAALSAGTIYYYKVYGFDRANLKYETGCLNFTTKSTVQTFNFRMFVPGEFVQMKPSTSTSFTNYNFSTSASEFSRYKNAEMNFAGHGITLRGVDISTSKSINFTNAFVSGNRSNFGTKFQGLNSSNWLETAQSLGMSPSDNVSLTIESAGNRLYKCDDSGGSCSQLTECYSVTSKNATHTTIDLAAAAGFSAYTVSDNAQLLTWDQTDSNASLYGASGASKTTADTTTFYANYSNVTSGAPINITGSYCEFNTTGISPVNMTYGSSLGLYSYSTQISAAGTHSWTSRCIGGGTLDNLNATDNVTIGSAPGAAPSTGGGGSSGTSPTPTSIVATPTPTVIEEPVNFVLNKDLIKLALRQGQSEKTAFIIENKGGKADVEISVVGIENLVFLDTKKLTLNKNEGMEIKGNIVVLESTKPGVYTGKISVKAGTLEKIVNVIVEVSSKRALFDVRLDLPSDQRSIIVGTGQGLITPTITLINIGDLEKVDVVLRYVVKDSENNIISETIETKGIEKQLSFARDLEIPSYAKQDNYVAYVQVEYQDSVAVASQLFSVQRSEGILKPIESIYLYIIVIIIIVVAILGLKLNIKRKGLERKIRRGRK